MRSRAVLVLLALAPALVAGTGCTSDVGGGGDGSAARRSSAPRCDDDVVAGLDAWGRAGFRGSMALWVEGEPTCEAAVGLADPAGAVPMRSETVFEIGSITKAFTAAAVFGLVDDGRLDLDDRAGELLPELTGPAAGVTVAQLLLHTSGLTGAHGQDHEPLSRAEAVAAIGRLELAFEPGTDEEYSNAGYTLLALIVEEVAGEPYRDRMASSVLPLPGGGVAGGFWDGEPAAPGPRAVGELDDGTPGEAGDVAGPHWALDGNGGLAMTVPQLAAWTSALFTGDVVSAASVAAISEPRVDLGDGQQGTYGWVALDAEVFGEPALAAAGGGGDVGQDAITVWLPETRQVLAIASNGPEVTAEDLAQAIGPALLAGDDLHRPEAAPPTVAVDDLDALAGRYELDDGGAVVVTADGDALELRPRGAAALAALFPLPAAVDPEDASRHGAQVLALLRGETAEGREERGALEDDLGAIDGVEVVGTIDDGELRTYVAIDAGGRTTTAWYALEDGGSIAAVELTDLPMLRVVPTTTTTFRPDGPATEGSVSAVAFDDDRLVIAAGATTTTAVRAG